MFTFLLIMVILESLALLGVFFKWLRRTYDGAIHVVRVGDPAEGGRRFEIELNKDIDPYELDKRRQVLFEIKKS